MRLSFFISDKNGKEKKECERRRLSTIITPFLRLRLITPHFDSRQVYRHLLFNRLGRDDDELDVMLPLPPSPFAYSPSLTAPSPLVALHNPPWDSPPSLRRLPHLVSHRIPPSASNCPIADPSLAHSASIRILSASLVIERSGTTRHDSIPRQKNIILDSFVSLISLHILLLLLIIIIDFNKHISSSNSTTTTTTNPKSQSRSSHPIRHFHRPLRKLRHETFPPVDGSMAV